MANYVSNLTVQVGDNSSATYNIRELFPHVGTCSTAAATAAKEVTIGNFKLYTGAWVVVKFNNTNSAAVASLTLNVDGTGAKPIKYRNANLASASQLIANRYTYFIYDGTNYQIVSDFNSDTYDRTSHQTRIYAGTIGVFNYSLCAMDNNQRMQSFTTTSGTGTAKTFNTSASFMYPPVIMYNAANSTYANGTAIANNVLYEQYPSVDLRYSCNVTSTAGFTQYKPVYLECTINSDGTFKLTTTGLTQTFTNGKYYILLGCMYNTSIYQLALFAQHPMFYYDGTHLNGIVYTAAEKTKLSGIANGATKVESSSNGKIKINGTDTTVYSHPTHTATSSGLYKITVDSTGHVSATTAVAKGDIPALDYSKVSISRNLTSGTKVGTITIDGTATDLYCQTNTNTDTLVSQTFATADKNRPLLMSYYDTGVQTTTAQIVHRNDALFFNPSSGTLRSPRLYLQTTGMPITINLDTLQPAAGENVNVLAVRYKNTDGTATHTVYPIGILGNSATGSGATNNSGVRLGSTNGTTIVCAGESSTTFAAAQAKYNDENLYFVADGAVYMYTNCSNDSTTVTGPWRVGGFTTGTSAITSGRVMITDGTTGGFKASDYTIAKSVPSDAKFSDTVTTVTTSGSGNAVTSITASNGALTVTKGSTFSLSTHTHNYAGSSSAGGPATNVAIARVTKDSKVFPGANKVVFEEYTNGTDYNLPSNHFYHIMSAQGNDTKYGTQLALGMTTTAAYYRVYNNKTWSDWKSLINTNTTYSANNGVGLSGTTFYNSGVRAVSIGSANGTISVNTNGTSADVAVKGLGTAAYKASSDFAVNQTLANDANLNNITTPGFYNVGGGNSVTNKPSNVDAFGLNVIHDAAGQWYTQILYPNNASPLIYVRNYNGSAWSGWNSIAIGSFLPLSGGTLTGELTFASFVNATADADRHIFFKHNTANKICTNDNFKYNPAKKRLYCTVVSRTLTGGTAVAGQDKGSGVSPRYFPAQWKFNAALTPADGDTIIIKIPGAGHASGVWLSVNNGTTYYPISNNNKTRLQTQFASGQYIELMFKSDGKTTTYPMTGANTTSDLPSSGGCWVVLNYYDSDSDTKVRQSLTSTSSNRPLLMSYGTTSTTDANVDNVAYRNNSIYANPSAGTITANKFYGNITGSGLNTGIYELINVDDPTFNGAEWMLTSIPSSPGGTSEPSFRRVKTAKFADYVTSNSRDVLFNDSTNTSKSITLSNPPTDTQYLKLYFKSSGNMGQSTMDNSVYSIAEVPYMTDVNLGGILQVAQPSDDMGVLKSTVLAFTIRITNHTLTLTKASYPSRLDGSTVANDTHLSANIIKVVAYR